MQRQRGERRAGWRLLAVAPVAALLVLCSVGTVHASNPSSSPLRFVGDLSLVDEHGTPFSKTGEAPRLAAYDVGLDRVVVVEQFFDRVVLVDPTSVRQTSVLTTPFHLGGLAPIGYDEEDHLLFYGENGSPASVIHVFNVTKPSAAFDFPLPPSVAGQNIVTMNYAKVEGHKVLSVVLYKDTCCPTATGLSHTTTLMLFDVDRLRGDAAHAAYWAAPTDISSACVSFTTGSGIQPYVGMAVDGSFAYLGCRGQVVGTNTTLSSHDAVVVDFDSPDPTKQNPSHFRVESYALGADLSSAFVIGDAPGERLIVLTSGGETNRTFVFDARHRAWTGSVPASSNFNLWGAVADPDTGRTYLIQQSPNVLVTEARSLPVPQGQEYDIGVIPATAGLPVFATKSRRLVIVGAQFSDRDDYFVTKNTHPASMRIYEDTLPHLPPLAQPDPDRGTGDIDEVPGKTPVTFSGGASGYGARLDLVGGLGSTQLSAQLNTVNSLTATFASLTGRIPQAGALAVPHVSGNDRVVTLGDVAETQVTSSSATATATGFTNDETTAADLSSAGLAGTFAQQVPESQDSHCGDTSGDSTEQVHAGSHVTCDLGELHASAEAVLNRNAASAGPKIGSGRATTTVTRGVEGVVARAEATATDVDLPLPNGGRVHIDEARNVARTTAHGRTGTARATLTPTLHGVTVYGPTGLAVFSCADNCNPAAVADVITGQAPGRISAVVPRADPSSASRKGAQAKLLKDPYVYWNDLNTNNDPTKEVAVLQITYYNDNQNASRLVVQLAGVLAESHFTVSAPFDEIPTTLGDSGADGVLGPLGIDAPGGTLEGVPPGGGPQSVGPAGGGKAHPRRLVVNQLNPFLLRTPGQALLLVFVRVLLGTPVYLSVRRRSLLFMQLEEVDG